MIVLYIPTEFEKNHLRFTRNELAKVGTNLQDVATTLVRTFTQVGSSVWFVPGTMFE
jgi:hypothetical protein